MKNETICIGNKLLMEYYSASTKEQKEFLNSNFTIDGTCSKESLIKLRDMACVTWTPKIEANHPDVFIKKELKTFADICLAAGTTEEIFYQKRLGYSPLALHTEECALIVNVLNEGWYPNFDDDNEEKYYIWWDMRNSKLHFDSSSYRYYSSVVPSHLCFKSEATVEKAKNFVEYFTKLFHSKFTL